MASIRFGMGFGKGMGMGMGMGRQASAPARARSGARAGATCIRILARSASAPNRKGGGNTIPTEIPPPFLAHQQKRHAKLAKAAAGGEFWTLAFPPFEVNRVVCRAEAATHSRSPRRSDCRFSSSTGPHDEPVRYLFVDTVTVNLSLRPA